MLLRDTVLIQQVSLGQGHGWELRFAEKACDDDDGFDLDDDTHKQTDQIMLFLRRILQSSGWSSAAVSTSKDGWTVAGPTGTPFGQDGS